MKMPALLTENWRSELVAGVKDLTALGITVSAIAKRADISRVHLHQLMAGRHKAGFNTLLSLRSAFRHFVKQINAKNRSDLDTAP
jgi:predicted transcriptional regulator